MTLNNLCKKLNIIDTHVSIEQAGYEIRYILFNGDLAKSPQHRDIKEIKYVPKLKLKNEYPIYGTQISKEDIPNKELLIHNGAGYWKKFQYLVSPKQD